MTPPIRTLHRVVRTDLITPTPQPPLLLGMLIIPLMFILFTFIAAALP